jgi:hypothetical protein
MAQQDKAAYWRALKEQDALPEGHFRNFTTQRLRDIYQQLAEDRGLPSIEEPSAVAAREEFPPKPDELAAMRAAIGDLTKTVAQLAQLQVRQVTEPAPMPVEPAPEPRQPVAQDHATPALNMDEHAGVTQNTHGPNDPVRTDEHGNVWFRTEVRKPAHTKARGRRVQRYISAAVKQQTIKGSDGYTETFEVEGDRSGAPVTTEVKVTLPSFQTGIYKAPHLPFKIHTYGGVTGFDLADVQRYYGSRELVPKEIKKTYVANDLCYDIQTVIEAVKQEYRERVLRKDRL